MACLRSAVGDFELVDDGLQSLSLSTSSSGGKLQSEYWHSYPFEKGEDLSERPWLRPEQIQTSFVGVSVIDVEKARVLEGMTVKTSKGLILSIDKTKAVDMQEDGWLSVDCKGLYMCPGLIDCHTHIIEDMEYDYGIDYTAAWMLKACLSNGFTTLRDVGGGLRRHRQAVNDWLIPGPRLFIGGPVLSQTGGHGDHGDRDRMPSSGMISDAHMGIGGDVHMALIVDGVDACLKATRKLMMAGADHVKICTSGGVLSPTDKLTGSQFTVPEIKAVCDTVRMMGGTLVTSHCNTDEGARNAIEGGIGGIEHGGLLSDETLKLMAKKGIHYTPTLIIQDYIVNGPMGRQVPKYSLEKAKLIAKNSYKVVKRAHELGVNIAYGTDAPAPIMLAEFDLRAKVLPAAAILQQATCNGAKVVDMVGKLGCIKPGAFADFLLLGANPLEDIGIMNKPHQHLKAVIKDGRCVKSNVKGLSVEISLD